MRPPATRQTVDDRDKDFLTDTEIKRFLDAARHGRHGTRDHAMMQQSRRSLVPSLGPGWRAAVPGSLAHPRRHASKRQPGPKTVVPACCEKAAHGVSGIPRRRETATRIGNRLTTIVPALQNPTYGGSPEGAARWRSARDAGRPPGDVTDEGSIRRPRTPSHPSPTCRASTERTTNADVPTPGDLSDAFPSRHPGVTPLEP
jgi:hypothetical protein